MTIYFLQPEDEPVIKIGYAFSVSGRIGALQTAHHRRLILLGTLPGGGAEELALHRRFSHLNVRGEWFEIDRELAAFLTTIQPPPRRPIEPRCPMRYNPQAPLVQAWFNGGYETDMEMAEDWRMDAPTLREALGESGRPHE